MVGFEVGMVLGEIELERRITNDIVKFTQFVSFFMIRVFQRVALYNVRQRMAHTVQYKIQHQHSRGFVADILREHRAVLLSNLVGKGNDKRACPG